MSERVTACRHNSVTADWTWRLGLLHCIFFVRAFGSTQPVDCEVDGLPGVFYARVNDEGLNDLVKAKARQMLDLQVAGKSTDEVVVSFFEKKMVKVGGQRARTCTSI